MEKFKEFIFMLLFGIGAIVYPFILMFALADIGEIWNFPKTFRNWLIITTICVELILISQWAKWHKEYIDD